jgi:sterol desaturase/sphingolipid hydroxylase (fatty acid hydroxylase superfamily)
MPSFANDTVLRFGIFAAVLAVMAALELLAPRRKLTADKGRRWATNLSIVILDSVLVRAMASLALPVAAVAAAAYGEAHGTGLLHWLKPGFWIETIFALVLLDFAIWLQHLLAHKIPLLWRLHQVHHADPDIDVTTAIRFHPIEIALSMLWKIGWVLLIGASPVAVLAFEVILNAGALFSHANVALPAALDGLLRLIIVTPDMHRVHHSVLRREHDSNYGFNLSIWDRLFRTYRRDPEKGHDLMTIGLAPYQTTAPTRLGWSLILPFRPLPNQNE